LLSNSKSSALEASVYDVKAVLFVISISYASKPVKLTVVKTGAASAVTSPPLPVFVIDVYLA